MHSRIAEHQMQVGSVARGIEDDELQPLSA
jgi:hypothetical protein